MVSLDSQKTLVKTVPNNYKYDIREQLTPTEYRSVLPTKFVFFDKFYQSFERVYYFIDRYQIENVTTGQLSVEKFRVTTTAVYTVLLYNTNNTEVCLTYLINLEMFRSSKN